MEGASIIMKRLTFLMAFCICSILGAAAQTIIQNNKFWDGEFLYVAHVQKKAGVVELKGMDINGNTRNITLKKGKKTGEYSIQQGEGDAPYGCMWGSRVQYIRKNGTNFLGFYVEEHTIGQTLVLTPDNIVNCTSQQERAETMQDPISLSSDFLFNQHYLFAVGPQIQQDIAGYLQSLPSRNFLEQTNLQLVSYVMTFGAAGDGPEPGEFTQGSVLDEIITVRSEREFLEALGSNRTIRIADGTTLFLTNMLNDEEFFSEHAGRAWMHDYYDERSGSEQLIVSCERFDGRQLELVNVHNLTIKGGRDCHIIVSPRYANVLNFYSCNNIRIENLTMGHTEEGHCEGGVIYAEGCSNIRVSDCDLYGCGTYGFETRSVDNLFVERTIVHDCSYGIMTLTASQYCTFQDCDFVRCREYSLIEMDAGCRYISFKNCRFAQNKGTLFANACPIELNGCEIYHEDGMGYGYDFLEYSGNDTTFDGNIDKLPARPIGPKK